MAQRLLRPGSDVEDAITDALVICWFKLFKLIYNARFKKILFQQKGKGIKN